MEEIRFNDSGKKISVSIDNETQEIPIYEIDRFKTFITLNQSLNTPLKEKIIVDASLNYLSYDTIEEDLSYTDNTDVNTNTIASNETVVESDYNTLNEDNEYSEPIPEINNQHNQIVTNNWQYGAEIDTNNIEIKQVDLDGIVTITIYNGDTVYYKKDVAFKKGEIKDIITNTLPIGEYKAVIDFAGNKYLQPTTLNIDFNVEKRLAFFIFDKEEYYGDPNESIIVSGVLKDSLTKKVIKECPVKFDFDSNTFSTTTNSLGIAYFNVDIPDTDITHCLLQPDNEEVDVSSNEPGDEYEDDPEEHLDFDDDGNIIEIEDEEDLEVPFVADNPIDVQNEDDTIFDNKYEYDVDDTLDYGYPNAAYSLVIYLDSDSYQNENTTVNIIANKLLTSTEIKQTSDVVNNIVTLEGEIKSHYKNEDKNAVYGNIIVSFDDSDYISNKISINTNGEFSTEIDFDEVNLSANKSEIATLIPYTKNLSQNTVIDITAENQVTVGEAMTATAMVHPTNSNLNIQDGMVVFILTANNKEVYRYGSQIDSAGRAVFFFNTSKKETYKIQAHYYGLFGYNESESEIKTIEVI